MHPILFHIGSLPIRAYGTLLVLGFLVGLWRAMRVCAHRMQTEPEGSPRRIDPDTIFDIGILGLMVGILGARVVFVILDWGDFAKRPLDALKVWSGGLSLHGGMLFGILFLIFYCRWKKLSLLAVGDLCATSWAIAYAIGRIGCLLNGCCYGAVCDLPWARPFRFPDERHPGFLTPPSHPTQLYGTLFNLVFFFLLTRWEKRPRRDGEIFFGYIALYGAYRFIVENFRVGGTASNLPGLPLTLTHIVSLLMIVGGIAAIAWLRRHRPAVQDADARALSASKTPPVGAG
jgi:phosphatidylglycerol:prolipoprotein diacylglycerol transferase